MDPWLEAANYYSSLDERGRSDYWGQLTKEQQAALIDALKHRELATTALQAPVKTPAERVPLRARLADGIVLCFAGWCLVSVWSEKVFHFSDAARTLLLLLFSFSGGLLGFFLDHVVSLFHRARIPSRYLAPSVRLVATGAIGAYLMEAFSQGCFSGLAVLCFGVFLFLILQNLGRPSQPPGSYSKKGSHSGSAKVRPLVTGASSKLREYFAMAVSGVATGAMGGTLRAASGIKNIWEGGAAYCLLPISVIVLGILVRLASVRLIQGKDHLKGAGGKALAVVDGFIVSTLLAIAVCAAELPPVISWNGTISRPQILWIPIGIFLGFSWGVVFGSIKILIVRAIQGIFEKPDGDHESTPRAALGEAIELVGESEFDAEHESRKHESSGGAIHPKSLRNLWVPCSCLLAILALLAAMLFALMASHDIWSFEKVNKDVGRLPKGCPKVCQGVTLDRFKLGGFNFSGADLSGAKLREADLDGANLRNAILRNAMMLRVDLRNADLSGADFTGADMREAILLNTRLIHTCLRSVYLRNATLQDLDLSEADLAGADLRDAVYNKNTKWPPGFDVGSAGLRLDD